MSYVVDWAKSRSHLLHVVALFLYFSISLFSRSTPSLVYSFSLSRLSHFLYSLSLSMCFTLKQEWKIEEVGKCIWCDKRREEGIIYIYLRRIQVTPSFLYPTRFHIGFLQTRHTAYTHKRAHIVEAKATPKEKED